MKRTIISSICTAILLGILSGCKSSQETKTPAIEAINPTLEFVSENYTSPSPNARIITMVHPDAVSDFSLKDKGAILSLDESLHVKDLKALFMQYTREREDTLPVLINTPYGKSLVLPLPVPELQSDTLVASYVIRHNSEKYIPYNVVTILIKKNGSYFINDFETLPINISEELDILKESYPGQKMLVFISVDEQTPIEEYFTLKSIIDQHLDKVSMSLFTLPYRKLNHEQRSALSDYIEFSREEYLFDPEVVIDDCGCTTDN